jgi:hypothetical protein
MGGRGKRGDVLDTTSVAAAREGTWETEAQG